MQLFLIIHHYNLNLLTTSYIQITMATNNDNGGHNVEPHKLSKFNSDGKLVKTVGGEGGRTGHSLSNPGALHSVRITSSLSGSGPGELATPWGICVDHDGDTTVYQYAQHIWSILCDHII